MKLNIKQGQEVLANGGIIAYPTETTFGLGCDAFNEEALNRLVKIKQRTENKGFIVLINNFKQLDLLTTPIPKSNLQLAYDKWPGPYTLVFPCLKTLPKLLTGQYKSIAIRMSSHQVANQLCQNMPIISTSANISGQAMATNIEQIENIFGELIDGIIDAKPGNLTPSKIINIITKQQYR